LELADAARIALEPVYGCLVFAAGANIADEPMDPLHLRFTILPAPKPPCFAPLAKYERLVILSLRACRTYTNHCSLRVRPSESSRLITLLKLFRISIISAQVFVNRNPPTLVVEPDTPAAFRVD
jgi:hypothetical protein